MTLCDMWTHVGSTGKQECRMSLLGTPPQVWASIHSSQSRYTSQSLSPTRKGPVYLPNRKGAMQKAWIRALYQKWPKKMPSVRPAC